MRVPSGPRRSRHQNPSQGVTKSCVGPLHDLTGMRIRGDRGMGRLASQFFRTLRTELEYLDQATANRLGRQLTIPEIFEPGRPRWRSKIAGTQQIPHLVNIKHLTR